MMSHKNEKEPAAAQLAEGELRRNYALGVANGTLVRTGMCGYCELCFGYFNPRTSTDEPPGVNGQCPTDAIRRQQIEAPYFEYRIDAEKCMGCGICVKGCQDSGNGSLRLQIMQDLCVHCNQCAIASACPAGAIRRVPARTAYLPRRTTGAANGT